MPALVAPLFGAGLASAVCLLVLPLNNLAVARASGSSRAPAVAIAETTIAGFLFAFFGPLVVIVITNMAAR